MNIIELAKQAGLKRHQEQAPAIDGAVGNWADLEKFAALVEAAARADEREECVRKASIALLGADKALTDRVLKAIRARGTT